MPLTIHPAIHQEIAEAFARQNHAGYDVRFQGRSYVADTDGDAVLDTVYFRGEYDVAPWHDQATVVLIDDCVDTDGNDFVWRADEDEPSVIEFVLENIVPMVEV